LSQPKAFYGKASDIDFDNYEVGKPPVLISSKSGAAAFINDDQNNDSVAADMIYSVETNSKSPYGRGYQSPE
jgi:hypothetical protein